MLQLPRPLPAADVAAIDAVLMRVKQALNLQIPKVLLGVHTDSLQSRSAVDGVDRQTEAVDLVLNGE
jgi:hypothetical protein